MKKKLAAGITGLLALGINVASATPVDTSGVFDDAQAQLTEISGNVLPWVGAVALLVLVVKLIKRFVK